MLPPLPIYDEFLTSWFYCFLKDQLHCTSDILGSALASALVVLQLRCSTFPAKEQLARGGSTLLPSFAVLLGPASTTSCTLIQRKAFPFLASGLALVCLPSQIIPGGSVGTTHYVWHDSTHPYFPIHTSDNTGVFSETEIVWKYVELNSLPAF